MEDSTGKKCKLAYLADKDGRECDFVTLINNKADLLIEVKSSDEKISTSLKYFKEKLKPNKTIQLVFNLKHDFEKDGVLLTSPQNFFKLKSDAA
jgi:predicted AAA+ superfamily ATPase